MLLLSKNCNSFQGLVLELCIHVSTFYQSQISPPLTCFTPTLSIQQRTTSLNRQKITGDAIFLPATSIISRSEFRPFYKVLQVVVAMAVQARTSLPGTTEPGRTGNKFVQPRYQGLWVGGDAGSKATLGQQIHYGARAYYSGQSGPSPSSGTSKNRKEIQNVLIRVQLERSIFQISSKSKRKYISKDLGENIYALFIKEVSRSVCFRKLLDKLPNLDSVLDGKDAAMRVRRYLFYVVYFLPSSCDPCS